MKKSVKIGLNLMGAALFGGAIAGISYLVKKAFDAESKKHKIYRGYYNITNQWLVNKQEGKDIVSYFRDNDIHTVAIYGMGTIGELLYSDIKNTDVKVSYFIDKNAEELFYGMDDIPTVGLSDSVEQEKVDAVIITPIHDFNNIAESLHDVGVDASIISVEDIIFGV